MSASGQAWYDSNIACAKNSAPPIEKNTAPASLPSRFETGVDCSPLIGFCNCTLLKPAAVSMSAPTYSTTQNTVDMAKPSARPRIASFSAMKPISAPLRPLSSFHGRPMATYSARIIAMPMRDMLLTICSAVTGSTSITTTKRIMYSATAAALTCSDCSISNSTSATKRTSPPVGMSVMARPPPPRPQRPRPAPGSCG